MKLPDHETHMGEAKARFDEARERMKQLANEGKIDQAVETIRSVNEGVVAPIFMGKDHETIPERYIIHWSETTCRNCGHVETSSNFFSLSYIRSRIGGTRVRHLISTPRPLYNLPVDRIKVKSDFTPYCANCPPIDLSHLPPPPEPSKLSDLPEPQLKGARRAPSSSERQSKEKPPTTKKPTLDDLI